MHLPSFCKLLYDFNDFNMQERKIVWLSKVKNKLYKKKNPGNCVKTQLDNNIKPTFNWLKPPPTFFASRAQALSREIIVIWFNSNEVKKVLSTSVTWSSVCIAIKQSRNNSTILKIYATIGPPSYCIVHVCNTKAVKVEWKCRDNHIDDRSESK